MQGAPLSALKSADTLARSLANEVSLTILDPSVWKFKNVGARVASDTAPVPFAGPQKLPRALDCEAVRQFARDDLPHVLQVISVGVFHAPYIATTAVNPSSFLCFMVFSSAGE